jgi:hypothetical protein
MLGLAAIAAVAAMAIIGVGTASATKLCKVNQATCTEENTYLSGTEVKGASEGNAKLVGLNSKGETELTVECASTTTVTTSAESGSPLPGKVTALTFTGCNNSCSVKVNGLPYEAQLAVGTVPNGTLTVKNGSATLTCAFGFVKCKVGAKELKLTVDGGNPAKVLAVNAVMELEVQEAGTCPAKADWNATYKATSPTNVFVTN